MNNRLVSVLFACVGVTGVGVGIAAAMTQTWSPITTEDGGTDVTGRRCGYICGGAWTPIPGWTCTNACCGWTDCSTLTVHNKGCCTTNETCAYTFDQNGYPINAGCIPLTAASNAMMGPQH